MSYDLVMHGTSLVKAGLGTYRVSHRKGCEMSAVMSKSLRREVLALANGKRDDTVRSVTEMLKRHASKAAKRRNRAGVSDSKIDEKVREQFSDSPS